MAITTNKAQGIKTISTKTTPTWSYRALYLPLEFSYFFFIKNKSGKWRMLTDLREVNKCIEPMGALQLGLPSPALIPQNWPVMVLDLKDCLFLFVCLFVCLFYHSPTIAR